LKSEIQIIKTKLAEIKSKINNNFPKKKPLLTPEYTDKYYQNRENTEVDYELKEIQKQIKFYEQEISKKKYQSDNIFPITKYLLIKDQIIVEKKKMQNIDKENKTLKSIYNSKIKGIDNNEIEISIKNSEEKNKENIINIKNEIKSKEKEYRELQIKLKEQRGNYSKLMFMINSIKNKIKDIKYLKNENISNKKIDYNDEIKNEEKNIEEEQKKFTLEEIEYKKVFNKNEKEINRLSKLILEKKNSFKNKRNDKRKKEINMKKNLNLNKKEYFENKKDILDYNPNEDNDQKTNNKIEENNEMNRGNTFFLTEQNVYSNNNTKSNIEKLSRDLKETNNNIKKNNINEEKSNLINQKSEYNENDLKNLSGLIIGEDGQMDKSNDGKESNIMIKSNNFLINNID
jgi:hypothetical protein